VPQVAGVFGDCIAGGGYMPIISDRVYMTEQAYMVIAGAALIKGAKSQKITSLDIGGPEVHVHQSGCADVRVPDDETLATACGARSPAAVVGGADFYRGGRGALAPAAPRRASWPRSCRSITARSTTPTRSSRAWSIRALFWEVLPDVGHRDDLRRRSDRRAVRRHRHQPPGPGRGPRSPRPPAPGRHPLPRRHRQDQRVLARLQRRRHPALWLHDISGFDIGAEAEAQGLLAYGSSLIYTNSTNQVPMFSVLLRKASGAGYYAMAGMPYDPVVQLSTCLSRLSVMEGRTLAIAAYNTKLDDDFQIAVADPAERAKIEAGMREVEARIEADMDPFVAARQMDTDEIVEVGALRGWLVDLVEMSYQAIGYRRIKNPRIWSLHDLAELTRGRP
jgi:3-methylcrotonyl-CoA carboxylase beta subunit